MGLEYNETKAWFWNFSKWESILPTYLDQISLVAALRN